MTTTTEAQGAPQGDLYHRVDMSPESIFQAIGKLRREAQDEVDRLLAFLDETDGDADFEPSLGYNGPGVREPWNDAEGDCEDEGAQCDDEGASDTGIGDADGLMEQHPRAFQSYAQRVE